MAPTNICVHGTRGTTNLGQPDKQKRSTMRHGNSNVDRHGKLHTPWELKKFTNKNNKSRENDCEGTTNQKKTSENTKFRRCVTDAARQRHGCVTEQAGIVTECVTDAPRRVTDASRTKSWPISKPFSEIDQQIMKTPAKKQKQ